MYYTLTPLHHPGFTLCNKRRIVRLGQPQRTETVQVMHAVHAALGRSYAPVVDPVSGVVADLFAINKRPPLQANTTLVPIV